MRLINTTDFENHFLRRMVSWICKQLDCPVRLVTEARFSRYSRSCRGTCRQGGRFRVMIGDAKHFPVRSWIYRSGQVPELADRIEALVEVTAHELIHLDHFRNHNGKRHQRMEAYTVTYSAKILDAFRELRAELVARWSELPARTTARGPAPTIVEIRAHKAEMDLNRWQRKLKFAKTKVKKLLAKVRYYQQKLSADKSKGPPEPLGTPRQAD